MAVAVISVGRVQRWISESRTTSDLRNASALYSGFVSVLCNAFPAGTVVMPHLSAVPSGVPNRVVAEFATVEQATVAIEHAVAAANSWWGSKRPASMVNDDLTSPPVTWAVSRLDYGAGGFEAAQATVASTKRTRTFPTLTEYAPRICSATGRRAARPTAPTEVRATGEHLSSEAWFKRAVDFGGFPSTRSVANATYFRAILHQSSMDPKGDGLLGDLLAAIVALKQTVGARAWRPAAHDAYPALNRLTQSGPAESSLLAEDLGWLSPETWDPELIRRDFAVLVNDVSVDQLSASVLVGRNAATALKRWMNGVAEPSTHLAFLLQDIDKLGTNLRARADSEWHRLVAERLASLATKTASALEHPDVLGRVVYAGGDDLLALVPATTALTAVSTAQDILRSELDELVPGVTASAAIVFFSASFPFQHALRLAKEGLASAKAAQRLRLNVRVLSGNSVRDDLIVPWVNDPIARLRNVANCGLGGARLAGNLDRVKVDLGHDRSLLRHELSRQVARAEALRGDPARRAQVVDDLLSLGDSHQPTPGPRNGVFGSARTEGVIAAAHLAHMLEGFQCR